MALFKKKSYVPLTMSKISHEDGAQPVVPDGMWVKCRHCNKSIYQKDIGVYKSCPQCGGYFRMPAFERISLICDTDTFTEMDQMLESKNPLDYPDYEQKIALEQSKSGLIEGVVTGMGAINALPCVLGVMDAHFLMGSMGSVVGEKVTRVFETATKRQLPVVLFTASGGARMQEGIVSLMQMAKVSAAVRRHHEAGLLYIAVLTDPTTGGVTASFAMLGDIILSEPGAAVGFAGRRVIEQTMNQQLPDGFQTAEFVQEHGFIDKIVSRPELKQTIGAILALHAGGGGMDG